MSQQRKYETQLDLIISHLQAIREKLDRAIRTKQSPVICDFYTCAQTRMNREVSYWPAHFLTTRNNPYYDKSTVDAFNWVMNRPLLEFVSDLPRFTRNEWLQQVAKQKEETKALAEKIRRFPPWVPGDAAESRKPSWLCLQLRAWARRLGLEDRIRVTGFIVTPGIVTLDFYTTVILPDDAKKDSADGNGFLPSLVLAKLQQLLHHSFPGLGNYILVNALAAQKPVFERAESDITRFELHGYLSGVFMVLGNLAPTRIEFKDTNGHRTLLLSNDTSSECPHCRTERRDIVAHALQQQATMNNTTCFVPNDLCDLVSDYAADLPFDSPLSTSISTFPRWMISDYKIAKMPPL